MGMGASRLAVRKLDFDEKIVVDRGGEEWVAKGCISLILRGLNSLENTI